MDITFDRATVSTCLQQQYVLPTYQREYKWEIKHLQELLTDIQQAFLDGYRPGHGRREVGGYAPYFLGTIISTSSTAGSKAIVDGQQRLTTLMAIIAYFSRLKSLTPDLAISNIEPLLRRQVYGEYKFNIEFDEDRAAMFLNVLNVVKNPDMEILDESIDSIAGLSESTRKLYNLFSEIENFLLEEVKNGLIPYFVDYITERVYLFEIGVPSEQDGHRVFVSMNDRGLKLSPIDLLKGHFLSKIKSPEYNARANGKWIECMRDLRKLGTDEDSAFFKTFLRAQYAVSSRGKGRGDVPKDFELIGDAYHRWVTEHSEDMGLYTSDDYFNFVDGRLPLFVAHYKKIRDAEEKYTGEFPYVFYNGAKDFTLQYMAILSAIDPNDSSADVEKKIKIVSYYIDYFASMRVINNKDNNYDNVRDPVFDIVKRIRRKTVADLIALLSAEISGSEDRVDGLDTLNYFLTKRQNLLHLLARFADYLENGVEQTNNVGFAVFVRRGQESRTFDIEHVLSAKLASVQEELGPDFDFDARLFHSSVTNLAI